MFVRFIPFAIPLLILELGDISGDISFLFSVFLGVCKFNYYFIPVSEVSDFY